MTGTGRAHGSCREAEQPGRKVESERRLADARGPDEQQGVRWTLGPDARARRSRGLRMALGEVPGRRPSAGALGASPRRASASS